MNDHDLTLDHEQRIRSLEAKVGRQDAQIALFKYLIPTSASIAGLAVAILRGVGG